MDLSTTVHAMKYFRSRHFSFFRSDGILATFELMVVKRVCNVLERHRRYRLQKNELRGETAGVLFLLSVNRNENSERLPSRKEEKCARKRSCGFAHALNSSLDS